jgi:hypothetical protein
MRLCSLNNYSADEGVAASEVSDYIRATWITSELPKPKAVDPNKQ